MNFRPLYSGARFLISASRFAECPPDVGAEVAFVGRSNAGKSSAINRLTNQKSLARTSKTPGRTQLLNFFELDPARRLVDLPGYGFARVPAQVKAAWHRSMDEYFRARRSLRGVFMLMDVRHPLGEGDWRLVEWCRHAGLDLHIALTKADKLSRGAGADALHGVRKALAGAGVNVRVQLFSSLNGTGLEEAWDVLDAWLPPSTPTEWPSSFGGA